MNQNTESKKKILIVDDSEINRSILADMLDHEFEILEAENGKEAITMLEKWKTNLSLVLLDIIMPEKDGFAVLHAMNMQHWIDDIPVIMISAESDPACMERAYELGATDYISRPFRTLVVYRRVINTIMLYTKQKKLIGLVSDQIYEKEKMSNLMVTILSHVVEFRNGESGLHVLHVQALTEMLLGELIKKTDRYHLTKADVTMIGTVSAIHDIGKIAIPDGILNKPGRLTEQEYNIMKTHTTIGAQMLEQLPLYQGEPMVMLASEVCRWHHERYDGKGYPDGLKGEEIPIYVQAVGLADAYDALTSDRVYKKACSNEEAIRMIVAGQCGVFHPLLLECLQNISSHIAENLDTESFINSSRRETRNIINEMLQYEELSPSERTVQLLEYEREKFQFFASIAHEILFEYKADPPVVTVSKQGAERLGINESTMDPLKNKIVIQALGSDTIKKLIRLIRESGPERPEIQYECQMTIQGERRWKRIICRTIWSQEEHPRYEGLIGKVNDIHEERTRIQELKHKASHDGLTGLLNHENAKISIEKILETHPDREYALMLFDMDYFKIANDTYGHLFGDHILEYLADKIRKSVRSEDVAARVGGDEFLIFMEYRPGFRGVADRIFRSLKGKCENFPISISMGIAVSAEAGRGYDQIFRCADTALYAAKGRGRGRYVFYKEVMKESEE